MTVGAAPNRRARVGAIGISLAIALGACGSPAPRARRGTAAPPRPPVTVPATATPSIRPPVARVVLEPTARGTRAIEVAVSWPAVERSRPFAHEQLAVGWLRRDEVDAHGPTMKGFVALLPRLRVFDVRSLATGGTFEVAVDPEAVALVAVVDREEKLFPTLFGRGVTTNALGVAPIEPLATNVAVATSTHPPTASQERCSGERMALLEVDAPEVAGVTRGAKHRLCVRLPASYARDGRQRYPVLYALPGLAGSDVAPLTGDDDFATLAEEVATAAGRSVIVVGVDTRSPYGSSYFARSAAQGDWETFGAVTMVAAVDARFRTVARADARALVGHSTGGFDAVSLAMRHPEVFGAVGASSPDALDLDGWLWMPDGKARSTWLGWMRVEEVMGGIGQLSSYAAAWSPDTSRPRGFAWPVDLVTGARVEPAAAAWQRASPSTWLDTAEGLARARKLSGRMFITCGQNDEAMLFEPTLRFVDAARAKGIDVAWRPTELGHLDARRARLEPLVRFVIERLATR